MAGSYIKIIKVPQGEAPLVIRQEWIDCVLPFDKKRPSSTISMVEISSLKKAESSAGFQYEVPIADALAILSQKSQLAAQWFRVNTSPFINHFLFSDDEAEEL